MACLPTTSYSFRAMAFGGTELRVGFDAFRESIHVQLALAIRRARAHAIRELLSEPANLTLEVFNREVWQLASQVLLYGEPIKFAELVVGPKGDEVRARELFAAFKEGELEVHGNAVWGSGSHVYGAPLHVAAEAKLEHVRHAARVLGEPIEPLEKAGQLMAIPGFGPNISTGLVMMFHPDEFAIYNAVSKSVVSGLGYPASRLDEYEESVWTLKEDLGATDFLELDHFLWLNRQGVEPDAQRAWIVRAGRDGQQEPLALDESVALIGWSDLGELNATLSRDDLKKMIAQTWGEQSERSLAAQAGQIYRFIHDIELGDLVVLPLKTEPNHVAVGRVLGPYQNRADGDFAGSDGRHTRAVEWLETSLPYERFDADLREAFGLQGTVREITKPDAAERILDVLEGADASAIHLVLKWSPGIEPETIEYHRAVADERGAVWWGRASKPGATGLSAERLKTIRHQLERGSVTNVYLHSAISTWRTRLPCDHDRPCGGGRRPDPAVLRGHLRASQFVGEDH
jgi:hypothetical protein